jgi:hypothetical protein
MKLKLKLRGTSRVGKSNLPDVLNATQIYVKEGLGLTHIAGDGYVFMVPKKELPVGDAGVIAVVRQKERDVAKIFCYFAIERSKVFCSVKAFLFNQQVDQSKFEITSLNALREAIQTVANTIKVAKENSREL